MAERQDTEIARPMQAQFVPGSIPTAGTYSLARMAWFMEVEPETLKGYLEQTKIKCCIVLGRTTYVDAALFHAGLKRQMFRRQEARGGGRRKE